MDAGALFAGAVIVMHILFRSRQISGLDFGEVLMERIFPLFACAFLIVSALFGGEN